MIDEIVIIISQPYFNFSKFPIYYSVNLCLYKIRKFFARIVRRFGIFSGFAYGFALSEAALLEVCHEEVFVAILTVFDLAFVLRTSSCQHDLDRDGSLSW